MDDQLLIQTLADIRTDIREMERRLSARIDANQPQCQSHADRLGRLEQTVTAMDSQRKTILGMVAFSAGLLGGAATYLMKFILGR